MLLTREDTTVRSPHTATREKPKQQQRPSPDKNKEIDKDTWRKSVICFAVAPFYFSNQVALWWWHLLDTCSWISLHTSNSTWSISDAPHKTAMSSDFPALLLSQAHRHNCPPSFQLSPSPARCQALKTLLLQCFMAQSLTLRSTFTTWVSGFIIV